MAKVRITREEAERGLLPPVCALTGVPTEDVKRKGFAWQPGWVSILILAGLLPYLIVVLIMRKTMTVGVPLVREKHGHWAWRTLVGLGCILASIALIVAGLALGGTSDRDPPPAAGVCFAAGMIGFLASLVVYIILNTGCIRPTEITDRDITLVKVHPNFVAALEEERDRDEEQYRRERQQRRKDRRREEDEEDEDDRPRKARRYDDDE
jgi:hypothetical protein